MLLKDSMSIEEAINKGIAIVEDEAVISPTVRIIPTEDDGKNHGIISVGKKTIIRENVIICSGVEIGDSCQIGHMVILRRSVKIGHHVIISHLSNIERNTLIGSHVRISALTHITGACIIEDDVQIGARVATINDNQLAWGTDPELKHPSFRVGCRVGSGVTIMGGVEIGAYSLIGAGSLVLRDIPEKVVAYGHPAHIQRARSCHADEKLR